MAENRAPLYPSWMSWNEYVENQSRVSEFVRNQLIKLGCTKVHFSLGILFSPDAKLSVWVAYAFHPAFSEYTRGKEVILVIDHLNKKINAIRKQRWHVASNKYPGWLADEEHTLVFGLNNTPFRGCKWVYKYNPTSGKMVYQSYDGADEWQETYAFVGTLEKKLFE